MTDPTYNNCCPELWKELHLRALNYVQDENTMGNETMFLNKWTLRVPVKGCRCADHWNLWYKNNPIDFSNYFGWTVTAHNAVNTKLGKPIWTVEQALEYWKTQTTSNI